MKDRRTWNSEEGVVRLGISRGLAAIIGLIIVVALAVLLLPPFSGLARLTGSGNDGGEFSLGPNGGSGSAGGVSLVLRSGVLEAPLNIKIQKDSAGVKSEAFPQNVTAVSSIYRVNLARPANIPVATEVTLDEPLRPGDNLDFFAREGASWEWVAGAILSEDGRKAKANLAKLPSVFVLARIGAQQPTIVGRVQPKVVIDSVARETLNVVSPLWHVANDDGSLAGPLSELGGGKFIVFPTIRNVVDGAYKGETINRILRSEEVRKRHVVNIVNLVKQNRYSGVDIDYQGIDPSLRDKFTTFISELASALHQENRKISLVLPLPEKTANGWETGGYDWYAVGKAADYLIVSAEKDQSVYRTVMPEVLSYATSQVDRRKLLLTVSTSSHEKSKAGIKDLTSSEALNLVGKVDVKGTPKYVPGETVTLYAPNLLKDSGASGLQWNSSTKTVTFSYPASDGQRTVWLENSFSVGYKVQYAKQLNLAGVSIQNLGDSATDKSISAVLQTFKTTGSVEAADPSGQAILPTWKSSDGSVASSESWANWTVPNKPGDKVTISLSVGDGLTSITATKVLVVATAVPPTPTSTPRPAATATSTPQSQQPQATAVVPPTPTTVVAAPPPSGVKYPGIGYGMQVDFGNDLPRALGLVRGAGFSWAKVQIRWNEFEPSKGNINWGQIDSVVNQMAANGVRVLFSVAVAPSWAIPSDYTDAGPPSNPQDFADFLYAIASRHPGKVHAYEVWNEQNVYHEWGGKGRRINAGKYVELLRAAYTAIKRADANAVVVTGGLTPTGFNDGDTAYDDVVYMEMMYQAGVKDYSDAIGVHGNTVMPYGATLPAGANGDHGSFYFRRFEQLRAVMQRYGDSGKQIWFTEFGWPSAQPAPWRFPRSAEISESQQAEWLVQAYQLAKEKGYVGVMLLWNLNFGPSADSADEWGKAAFSVLNRDWSPRAAYNALVGMPK